MEEKCYPRYIITRMSNGGYVVCDCGRMNCAVTRYAEYADRAYHYSGPCESTGHTAPVECYVDDVPIEDYLLGTAF